VARRQAVEAAAHTVTVETGVLEREAERTAIMADEAITTAADLQLQVTHA